MTVVAPAPAPTGGTPTSATVQNRMLTTVVVAAVVVVAVLFGFFSPVPLRRPPIPDVAGSGQVGLQYATTLLTNENWKPIQVYDSLGENRGIGDFKGWRVCFQDPKPGARKNTDPGADSRDASLGVVKTAETCPVRPFGSGAQRWDYGSLDQVYDSPGNSGTHRVPLLTGYTPFMARQGFGEDASIRVLKLPLKETPADHNVTVVQLTKKYDPDVYHDNRRIKDFDTVGGDPGDWVTCFQNPMPSAKPWNGRVLTLWVVPVDDIPNRGHSDTFCDQLRTGQPAS